MKRKKGTRGPIETRWVAGPAAATGQDHLGTAAVCETIYDELLPGITNNTDRARLFAFYPWLVRSLHEQGVTTAEEETDLIRRAECLLCLIGLAHEAEDSGAGLHSTGLTGRRRLRHAWQIIADGKSVKLSNYATREDVPTRYFMSRLGGLGVYYLGSLNSLRVLTAEDGRVKFDRDRGTTLASAFKERVDGAAFFGAIRKDRISADTLHDLSSFCPCRLRGGTREHELLTDLLFARVEPFDVTKGVPRRRTLILLLNLARSLDVDSTDHEHGLKRNTFSACAYSGTLPSGRRWSLPRSLESTREGWAEYERAELLSLAVQAVFFASMASAAQRRPLLTVADVAGAFVADVRPQLSTTRRRTFRETVEELRRRLPALTAWGDPTHEVQLGRTIRDLAPDAFAAGSTEAGARGVELLLTLIARGVGSALDSGEVAITHPIRCSEVDALARGAWSTLQFDDWLGWIVSHWGVEVHTAIALHKLRVEDKNTFQIMPVEDGYEVLNTLAPTPTSPRISSSLQLLRDLRLVGDDGGPLLTPAGGRLLEALA